MALQYDMFEERAVAKAPFAAMSEANMVRHLQATGQYRILTKIQPRQVVEASDPTYPLRGIILDTETTDLNARKHEIIEIGIIAFSFDERGAIGDVTAVYRGLQQPTSPIPADITRLTGLTDAMVAGKAIDLVEVEALIQPADLMIAHNAGFDRPFCELFSPVFANKAWACSVSEIDWSARGFEGTKLGYLVGQAGYFHEGHRAVDDCFALLEVLDRDADRTPFAQLYRASQRSRVRIFAEHSPFDLKEHLKARGYRWSIGSEGSLKSWWIELDEHLAEAEMAWLRSEIYGFDACVPMLTLTAFDRYKGQR